MGPSGPLRATMPDSEREALLNAIQAALGRGEPLVEQSAEREAGISLGSGTSAPLTSGWEVLAGAVEPGRRRVAWIEQRSADPTENGFVDVAIDLCWAWDGALRGRVPVQTYNPYFGCRPDVFRWSAGAIVYAYHEKHRHILARLDPDHPELHDEDGDEEAFSDELDDWGDEDADAAHRMVALTDPSRVIGEVIWSVDEKHGVLQGRRLSDLAATIAVVIPRSTEPQELFEPSPGQLAIGTWGPRTNPVDPQDWRAELERARAHARTHAEVIPLPPADVDVPSSASLTHRFEAMLIDAGVVPEAGARIVRVLGEPWCDLAPRVVSYAGLRRPAWRAPEDQLDDEARAALEKLSLSEPGWGWPGLEDLDANLDLLWRRRLATAARRMRDAPGR